MNLDQWNNINRLLKDLDWCLTPRQPIRYDAEDLVKEARVLLKETHDLWRTVEKPKAIKAETQ